MARAPVSKTGGWGFESLHSCQFQRAEIRYRVSENRRFPSHGAIPDPCQLDGATGRQ
jgi:hypothetical protein